jgi:hypothetical protein
MKNKLYVVFDKTGIQAIVSETSVRAAKTHFHGHILYNDLMIWETGCTSLNHKTFCVSNYPSWLEMEWKDAKRKGCIRANAKK